MKLPHWLRSEYWRIRLLERLESPLVRYAKEQAEILALQYEAINNLRSIVPAYGFMAGLDIPLYDRTGSRFIGKFPDEIIKRRTLIVFEGSAPLVREVTHEELFGDEDLFETWWDFPADGIREHSMIALRTMKRSPSVCAHDLTVEYGAQGWVTFPFTEIRPIVERIYRMIVTLEMEEMPLWKFTRTLSAQRWAERPRGETQPYFGGTKTDTPEADIALTMYQVLLSACDNAATYLRHILEMSIHEVTNRQKLQRLYDEWLTRRAARDGEDDPNDPPPTPPFGKKEFDDLDRRIAYELDIELPITRIYD